MDHSNTYDHYFPSKIDLAAAAMDEAFEQFRPMLDEVFSSSKDPVKRFEDYADMGYEAQKEIAEQHGMVCGCPFVSLGSEMAPQDETIRAKTDEIISRHKKYYETTLRDMVAEGILAADTDVQAKADKIYSFIMGQLVMARIQNSLEPMKRDLKTGLFRMIEIKEKMLEEA